MIRLLERWRAWRRLRRGSTIPPDTLALIRESAAIIHGDTPGARPRGETLGIYYGPFPAFGEARLHGRWLCWSGPFSYAIDMKYGQYLRVDSLDGVLVHHQNLGWFILTDSSTWATLWPPDDEDAPVTDAAPAPHSPN